MAALSGRQARREVTKEVTTEYAGAVCYAKISQFFEEGEINVAARRHAIEMLIQECDDMDDAGGPNAFRRRRDGVDTKVRKAQQAARRMPSPKSTQRRSKA